MPIEIIVPRLGWSMEEGAFVAWLKKDGDFVRAGEPLFSIEGDKAVQEIESIDSGFLRIAADCPKPGAGIRVGDLLGHLLSADELSAAEGRQAPGTGTIATPEAKFSPPGPVRTRGSAPSVGRTPGREVEARKVEPPAGAPKPTISPRALRVAAELGVDWTKVAGTGRTGRIRERDIRAAVGRTATPQAALSQPSTGTGPVVLVTGGYGFIGSWVVRELLGRGLQAVVLDASGRPARWERIIGRDSERVPVVQGGLLDRALLRRVFHEYHVTHVIHLAALLTPACQADPWRGCEVNVLGSLALFEEVRASARPIQGFSYASSVAVFGEEPGHANGKADEANQPPTFYGAFKKAVELIAAQYWRHFQIASLGIRPQVAYGPERDTGLTAGPSLAARAAAEGGAFAISYTGRIGYDYVEDVARAFVRGALETPRGAHVVDLPGHVADVHEVIAAIIAAAPDATGRLSADGPVVPASTPLTPHCISSLYPDWQTTPLAEGLRRTVDFYRAEVAKR